MSPSYKGGSSSLTGIGARVIEFGQRDRLGRTFLAHEFDHRPVVSVVHKLPQFPWQKSELPAVARITVTPDGVYARVVAMGLGGAAGVVQDIRAGAQLVPMGAGRIDEHGNVLSFVLSNLLLYSDGDADTGRI